MTDAGKLAELQALLEGVDLPATKTTLVEYAHEHGADAGQLETLDRLPEAEYASVDDVAEALRPVQPTTPAIPPSPPEPESGAPPGGDDYDGHG